MITKLTKVALLFTIGLLSFNSIAETTAFIRRGKIKQRAVHSYRVEAVLNKKIEGLHSIKGSINAMDKESPELYKDGLEMKITDKTNNGHYIITAHFDLKRGDHYYDEKSLGESFNVNIQLLDKNGKLIGNKESFQATVELDKETCNTKVKIESITLEGLNYLSPRTKLNEGDNSFVTLRKSGPYHLCIENELYAGGLKGKTNPRNIYLNAQLAIDDLRTSTTSNYFVDFSYNEKTERYEATWPDLDSVYVKSITVDVNVCGEYVGSYEFKPSKIISVNNNAIGFATKKVKDKDTDDQDSTNSCSGNYRLIDGGSITFDDKTSVLTMNSTITIDSKESKPNGDLTLEVIVHLKNCDGKSIHIGIPAKFNEKTGSYFASKALPRCGSGIYQFESVTYKGKDKCGNSSVWVRNWQW